LQNLAEGEFEKLPSGFTNSVRLKRVEDVGPELEILAFREAIFFTNVMSHWFSPGPQQIERRVVEKVPNAGSLNWVGSRYR